MRYLVDGYNLLFKTAWIRSAESLEEARTLLIKELDYHASLLKLHITLVFDAPLQSDELKRGHYRSLEIIFTSYGETADDFLHTCAHMADEKIVVVTSDKKLAHRVKGCGAYVENVRDFLIHLRKKSQKKLMQSKKVQTSKKTQTSEKVAVPREKKPLDPKALPSLSDIDAWQQIFEDRLRDL